MEIVSGSVLHRKEHLCTCKLGKMTSTLVFVGKLRGQKIDKWKKIGIRSDMLVYEVSKGAPELRDLLRAEGPCA